MSKEIFFRNCYRFLLTYDIFLFNNVNDIDIWMWTAMRINLNG